MNPQNVPLQQAVVEEVYKHCVQDYNFVTVYV